MLAAFVAARTRALRLGMGVSLLPLHHPVDLAEELAVLDVVSAAARPPISWAGSTPPCRSRTWMALPGLPTELALRSMRLSAEEVGRRW